MYAFAYCPLSQKCFAKSVCMYEKICIYVSCWLFSIPLLPYAQCPSSFASSTFAFFNIVDKYMNVEWGFNFFERRELNLYSNTLEMKFL